MSDQYEQIFITINTGTKKLVDGAKKVPLRFGEKPQLLAGDTYVLCVTFVDNDYAPITTWSAGDTFALFGDTDFTHDQDSGTLDSAYSGAVTSIVASNFTSEPPDTGFLHLRKDNGNRERVEYTARSGSGTGPYTFTVSATLINSYESGDYIGIEDDLMVSIDNDNVNVAGDWADADNTAGKVSFRVPCDKYEFIEKITAATGQQEMILQFIRFPGGGAAQSTVGQDTVIASETVRDLEGTIYNEQDNWSANDARYIQRGDAALLPATELTLATGAVTRTQWMHTLDTEADAASDDLDTISGGAEGDVLRVYLANAARIVTLKHGTGNIATSSGADIVMASGLYYDLYNDGTNWIINDFIVSGASLNVTDSTFRVVDDGDATKKLAFECSGITTATTRTWTVPDADGTFVGLSNTQTLTNKTLTSPSITTPTVTSGKLTMPATAEIEAATSLQLDSPDTQLTGKLTTPAAGEIEAATSLDLDAPFVGIDGATQVGTEKFNVSGGAIISGVVGINTTGADAQLDVLATTEQLRTTYTDGTVYTAQTTDSSGYHTIDPTGGRVIIDGDLYADGVVFDAATELTIATGSVTAEQALHSIDTEADAASDDLDTIVATNYAGLILVRAANAARTVVLKDGTGNLELGGADIELDDTDKFVILAYDTALTKWLIAGGSALGVTDYIDFTTGAANPSHLEGRLFYDDSQKCLASYNDETDFTHQFGRETTLRVKNTTGVTINSGQVVYISGQNVAGIPLVALAKADAESTANAKGIATTSIANNTEGEVTISGTVNGLDLSAYSENDEVWLSATTAGAFTGTAPSSPNIRIQLGTVSFSNVSTGSLVVDIRYFGVESDYAEISAADNVTATTISAANTWYQIGAFDANGASQGATPDHTNDHITINKSAAYSVSFSCSFSGGLNDVYQLAVYKNNGATRLNDSICERKMNSNGDIGVVSMACICDLTDGDTVEAWINNNTDTDDATVKHAQLRVSEVGNLSGANPISNLNVDGLTMSSATELTISSGSVTATQGIHRIDTESDVSSDDLDTIVATSYAGLLMVRAENAARTIVLKDGTGNLELGGTDIIIDDTNRFVLLQYDTGLSKWLVAGTGGLEINGLTEETSPDYDSDHIPFYDSSAGENRKALISDMIRPNVNAQTGTTYTFVLGDAEKIVTLSNASSIAVTIPTNASVAFPVNTTITCLWVGAGTPTITGDTGVTVNGVSAGGAAMLSQYSGVTLLKTATNAWVMFGAHGTVA